MHEQAEMIEQQAKATASAQPQAAYGQQAAQPAAPQGYNYGGNQYQQQQQQRY